MTPPIVENGRTPRGTEGRSLVTGATGCVGRRVIRRLAADGVPFRALVRTRRDARLVQRLGGECWLGDLTRPETLRGIGRDVDAVYHCAGKVDLWGRPEAFARVNVHGLEALLSACGTGPPKRFLHVSTASVHREPLPAIVNEDSSLSGTRQPYIRSKVEAERLVRSAHEAGVVAATILRPVHIHGPRSAIVTETAARLRTGGRTLISFSRGWMPLVFVDDLVDAMVLARRCPAAAGEAFFVAYDRPYTWNDFVLALADAFGLDVNPSPLSPIEAHAAGAALELAYSLAGVRRRPPILRTFLRMVALSSTFSTRKARRTLGFVPAIDLVRGMRLTGAWFARTRPSREGGGL